MKNNNYDVTFCKSAKLSPLQKRYLELEEIIKLCGYNEEMQGFDLVLAIKQIIEAKEQECETLKDEIKLAKEMLIQNDYKTNKNTLPQIIEEFISYNLLDMQNNEGYTIPVFIQVENKLEILEDLEQVLDEIEEFCTVYSANHDAYETVYKYILAFINKAKKGN